MVPLIWLVLFLTTVCVVAFRRPPLPVTSAALGAWLLAFTLVGRHSVVWDIVLWAAFLSVAGLLNIVPLRRRWVSDPLFTWFREVMPTISETERQALDAGTVWWDGDLFSGRPDWKRLLGFPKPSLTDEEQAFLDGPVDTLCRMVDDWDVTHRRMDLPPEAWQFIKENGFFGLIIPRAFGGKGFSALAHSAVAMKLASRSGDLGSTVMVPNSLGPAELLMRYGTDDQRQYYLPRLARGEEVPCFALTGPWAGSDAGAIPDTGVVCHGEWQGEEVLGLRLNWEKRYITLGPVATLLGVAFKAYDPDHLLGEVEELGITLALIPTDTPGVEIGRRHFPLNAAFMNGPNRGRDVFIPLHCVIGDRKRIGEGWQMLMNCLSVGRSISLPSGGTAVAKKAALTTGAYARIREQFRVPIGEFEGVQEALGRIAGNTYVMDAARVMTAGAVDLGEEPAVLSAVVKYHLTERQRQCIADAMDVHGGKGICLGPGNYLGRAWQTAPISITVEGSNILTRNMMIFGQGAIRCHPFVLEEILATQQTDQAEGRRRFDRLLVGHLGFGIANAVRSLTLALTGGRPSRAAGAPELRGYYRQLSRFAAAFALAADVCMLVLGGALKRRERLSARMGDVLSYLYLASACLKRYEDEGRQRADLPLVRWGVEDALYAIQCSLDEVIANFPSRPVAWLLRALIFPLGRRRRPPSDTVTAEAARLIMAPDAARDRLIAGIYRTEDPSDAAGAVEDALQRTLDTEAAEQRLREVEKRGELEVPWHGDRIEAALAAGIVDEGEADALRAAQEARRRVIMVDD
ncbi:MAG TPA: acyl-CoA dehydrogenase, partial [Gammaproteobacteria bacterium]|nr:acyl-CoA dehydrogenase [Gammaproteobacteria bacterium]